MENKPLPVYQEPRLSLDRFDEKWRGWIIHGATLWSPEGWQFTAARILAAPILEQQAQALRAELETARRPPAPTEPPRVTQYRATLAALDHLASSMRADGNDDELAFVRALEREPRQLSSLSRQGPPGFTQATERRSQRDRRQTPPWVAPFAFSVPARDRIAPGSGEGQSRPAHQRNRK
jgi:hypothetical protein